jgi:hypothetical protein
MEMKVNTNIKVYVKEIGCYKSAFVLGQYYLKC